MAPKTETTQATFAEQTGMSRQRVSRFVKMGVIPTNANGKIPMPAGLHALIDHLCETAAGRGGTRGVASLTAERARLAAAQADLNEHKLAIQRGEYIPASAASHAMDKICTAVRNRLLSVPSELPVSLPHLSRHDLDVIDRFIRDALTELADGFEKKDVREDLV